MDDRSLNRMPVSSPLSDPHLADDDLRAALELATEEELRELTEILFRPKFNPIDYVAKLDPLDIQSLPHGDWLDALEDRFRFLAADGVTVLQRRSAELSYQEILLQVCRHLRLPYYSDMSAIELESEIFLHLLERAWEKMPAKDKNALNAEIQVVIASSDLVRHVPESLRQDPLGLLLKGGSAIAVSAVVRPVLLRLIAQQFALHFARYELARQTIQRGGLASLNFLTLKTAQQGMASSLARYGAARSVLAFVGPVLWTWFFADLGWRSISTNYGRVIPTVFALAQIRLTRLELAEA